MNILIQILRLTRRSIEIVWAKLDNVQFELTEWLWAKQKECEQKTWQSKS